MVTPLRWERCKAEQGGIYYRAPIGTAHFYIMRDDRLWGLMLPDGEWLKYSTLRAAKEGAEHDLMSRLIRLRAEKKGA